MRFSALFLMLFCLVQLLKAQSVSSIDSLKKALKHTEDELSKLAITNELSEELYKNNPSQALAYAHESELLAQNLGSDSLLNNAYINQATAYLHIGNYPKALQLYQKAIIGAQKLGDSNALFSVYERLGILYHFQNNNRKAIQYFFYALTQFSKKNITNKKLIERKAYLLKNIGIVYNETKNYSMSADYFNQALTLAKQLNNHELMANVLNYQGSLFLNQGNKDLALKQYLEALQLRKESNNKWGLASSYLSIGQYYFNQKDYANAEIYLKEAIESGKQVNFWPNVSMSSLYLYQLYKQKGDYKNALTAFELNNAVNDTLFSIDRVRKMQQLEMQYDFDRKQAELKAQQRKKEMYYWLGTITLFFLLSAVFVLYLWQRNKTKKIELEQLNLQLANQELETDLVTKEQELAAHIKHLSSKNELINEVSEKLLAIKQNVNAKTQNSVQKITMDIQANLQPELLDELELRFQQVNENFYKNLNDKFVDLTPSERRLCALLKLNMSTKDISTMTHQSTKAIDVARTRLRKKLNLTGTDQSLAEFLEQF
ncbi:hypothetical protein C3K47_04320 [Solitalea longa]|uniref:HTH luxR-type domain-containing protein n=1 Tax=Solitalea longa TaxID=2079460 RepID=A0A2S5A7X3_9SPHI|nr:tetratricopeptide repeat protein [Solitalea longa]POY38626.1 hypothetical protein C3K47_04320 [Solitalea longa]